MSDTTNTVAKPREQAGTVATFRDDLVKLQPIIAQVLPQHMNVERIIRIAIAAISRTPLLLKCERNSVLQAVMAASQMGLEPNTPLQHSAIIPFWNGKTNRYEAQFQPMYRGLVDLAHRSGRLLDVRAKLVYEHDHFEYEEGTAPKIVHKPKWDGERGKVRCAYMVADLKDTPIPHCEVMTLGELDEIKNRTKSRDKQGNIVGPWISDEKEMFRKTVLKRGLKMCPMSIELATAVQIDNAVETGDVIDYSALELAALPYGESDEPQTQAQRLVSEIAANGKVKVHGGDRSKLIQEIVGTAAAIRTEDTKATLTNLLGKWAGRDSEMTMVELTEQDDSMLKLIAERARVESEERGLLV